eukprot:221886_1
MSTEFNDLILRMDRLHPTPVEPLVATPAPCDLLTVQSDGGSIGSIVSQTKPSTPRISCKQSPKQQNLFDLISSCTQRPSSSTASTACVSTHPKSSPPLVVSSLAPICNSDLLNVGVGSKKKRTPARSRTPKAPLVPVLLPPQWKIKKSQFETELERLLGESLGFAKLSDRKDTKDAVIEFIREHSRRGKSVEKIPDEHRLLVARLVEESTLPIKLLTTHIQSILFPPKIECPDVAELKIDEYRTGLPFVELAVRDAITKVAVRKNYGVPKSPRVIANDDPDPRRKWIWEMAKQFQDMLPRDVAACVRSARNRRRQVSISIRTHIQALKILSVAPLNEEKLLHEIDKMNQASTAIAALDEKEQKQLEKESRKEEERAKKEAQRAAKEKQRLEKEAAREAQRVAKEKERAAKEQERAAKEKERAAKEAARRDSQRAAKAAEGAGDDVDCEKNKEAEEARRRKVQLKKKQSSGFMSFFKKAPLTKKTFTPPVVDNWYQPWQLPSSATLGRIPPKKCSEDLKFNSVSDNRKLLVEVSRKLSKPSKSITLIKHPQQLLSPDLCKENVKYQPENAKYQRENADKLPGIVKDRPTIVKNNLKSRHFDLKLLQFYENRRPAYFGLLRRRPSMVPVGPRRPFARTPALQYDVDSDDEWESDQEEDGENLLDSDLDDEEEAMAAGDGELRADGLIQDDFLVAENDPEYDGGLATASMGRSCYQENTEIICLCLSPARLADPKTDEDRYAADILSRFRVKTLVDHPINQVPLDRGVTPTRKRKKQNAISAAKKSAAKKPRILPKIMPSDFTLPTDMIVKLNPDKALSDVEFVLLGKSQQSPFMPTTSPHVSTSPQSGSKSSQSGSDILQLVSKSSQLTGKSLQPVSYASQSVSKVVQSVSRPKQPVSKSSQLVSELSGAVSKSLPSAVSKLSQSVLKPSQLVPGLLPSGSNQSQNLTISNQSQSMPKPLQPPVSKLLPPVSNQSQIVSKTSHLVSNQAQSVPNPSNNPLPQVSMSPLGSITNRSVSNTQQIMSFPAVKSTFPLHALPFQRTPPLGDLKLPSVVEPLPAPIASRPDFNTGFPFDLSTYQPPPTVTFAGIPHLPSLPSTEVVHQPVVVSHLKAPVLVSDAFPDDARNHSVPAVSYRTHVSHPIQSPKSTGRQCNGSLSLGHTRTTPIDVQFGMKSKKSLNSTRVHPKPYILSPPSAKKAKVCTGNGKSKPVLVQRTLSGLFKKVEK